MPDLQALDDLERLAGFDVGVTFGHLPQVMPLRVEILARRHILHVVIVLVGAADHVLATL